MSIIRRRVAAHVFFCILTTTATQAGMFGVKIGPVWPRRVVQNSQGTKTALDIGIEWGGHAADIAIFGGAIDLQWNRFVETEDSTHNPNTKHEYTKSIVKQEIKRYLIPLTGFLGFDPIPGKMIHPVLKGHFGVAMMPLVNRDYTEDNEKGEYQGVYWGLYGRIAGDAHFNLGTDLASVFIGLDYQWANMRKRDWDNDAGKSYFYQDMSGFGVHIGLRLRT